MICDPLEVTAFCLDPTSYLAVSATYVFRIERRNVQVASIEAHRPLKDSNVDCVSNTNFQK